MLPGETPARFANLTSQTRSATTLSCPTLDPPKTLQLKTSPLEVEKEG